MTPGSVVLGAELSAPHDHCQTIGNFTGSTIAPKSRSGRQNTMIRIACTTTFMKLETRNPKLGAQGADRLWEQHENRQSPEALLAKTFGRSEICWAMVRPAMQHLAANGTFPAKAKLRTGSSAAVGRSSHPKRSVCAVFGSALAHSLRTETSSQHAITEGKEGKSNSF